MVSSTKAIPAKKSDYSSKEKIKGGKSSKKWSPSEFKEECLNAHNECRKKHNTALVKWSDTLAKNAQNWADHLAKNEKFEHAHANQRKGEGENIYCGSGSKLDGYTCTMKWYDEIKDYDFNAEPAYSPKTGHFTQVVWATTTEIGAGRAKANNGMDFAVARYFPAGNDMNMFADNIKPPVDDGNINHRHEAGKKNVEGSTQSSTDAECERTEGDESDVQEDTDEDDSQGNSIEMDPVCSEDESTSEGTFEIEFLQKMIKAEKQYLPEIRISEILSLTEPVDKACYRKRKDNYLQKGFSYVVIHGFYE